VFDCGVVIDVVVCGVDDIGVVAVTCIVVGVGVGVGVVFAFMLMLLSMLIFGLVLA